MGADFTVDCDLNVWMTEAQRSPGLRRESFPAMRKFYQQIFAGTAHIVEEIMTKQSAGQAVFPLDWMGSFELIYTDEYQYRYDPRP